ncbi:HAD-IA family hydrolase [Thalassolituus pacificus]|jgi:phosphoglycolate phosphatase|uniref:HAD-IA family hydrolase n=1 Tax=Thalassolituus pacificus TaxID=2975440 RepID=A0A9X2WEA9_9GAMM|nr:HAD-IA family hydrolase [Thalassolituus pacificus]MCT7358556.1 HAD-IA family hydrolase [Thalassolituus pacificus]
MSLTRPKAILFDLDGTLVDSAPDFYAVVNGLRQEAGKASLTDASIREQVSNGGAALTRLTWEIDDSQADFADYRARLLARYSDHIGSASALFPGFAETLSWLNQEQILWGIVTNKPRPYTEPLLQRLNIQAAVVVCPDDVSHAKPHPEPLLKAAADLGLQAADCWYVGDHIRDIDAALAAGMLSIAATFGYIESGDDPRDWQADLQIDQPHDLITLLRATL